MRKGKEMDHALDAGPRTRQGAISDVDSDETTAREDEAQKLETCYTLKGLRGMCHEAGIEIKANETKKMLATLLAEHQRTTPAQDKGPVARPARDPRTSTTTGEVPTQATTGKMVTTSDSLWRRLLEALTPTTKVTRKRRAEVEIEVKELSDEETGHYPQPKRIKYHPYSRDDDHPRKYTRDSPGQDRDDEDQSMIL